jgi:hypothetical protein
MRHSLEVAATVIFALAVLHTFIVPWFERRAHRDSANAGRWHLFGEVDAVFGIWAAVLLVVITLVADGPAAVAYFESCDFTEPMFVFAIMVIAASRPMLQLCANLVSALARALPLPPTVVFYFVVLVLVLVLVPLFGSFITDNVALTYLGSLVDGTDDAFKYALVAGAVTGGGLTVIANAPNPAGYSILKRFFPRTRFTPAGYSRQP